jgi:GntR family transcriptional regulator
MRVPTKAPTREQGMKQPKRSARAQVALAGEASDPLYVRVARTLKEEIVAGTFPVGAPLPTEEQLCTRFSVSRHTVREALRRLREDHLVASRQGAGTIVVSGHDQDAYAHDIMSINDLVSWAAGKRFGIESLEVIALPEELAARTGLRRGDSWLAVRGFGYEAGVTGPVCSAEYYIHHDFAAVGRLLHRHTGPIFPLIEDLFGVKVAEVHQTIAATLIGAELARPLSVELNSPGLEVQRTYQLSNRQVAQVTVSTHPAARYRHSTTLRRVKR